MTTDPRHLVLRAPNWVGDLVMATPILEAAAGDPRFERVTVVVRSHLAGVLSGSPYADRVVPVGDTREEVQVLRGCNADAVLLLTNSLGAAWRAYRAGIPMRAGSALGGRGLLLTHRVVPATCDGRRVPIPTAHLLRDVAGLFGIQVPSLHPRLYTSPAELQAVREMLEHAGLERDEDYILCAPSAAFGAAKLWPPTHFASALDQIYLTCGWRAVITGGPGEEEQMEAVARATSHASVSLVDEERDLPGLKALVEGARLLLVGDSGPRWFAAAFDVPCVSVMGPNFPELTATSLEWCEIVRVEGLECAPCLRRTCPFEHHRCMRDLDPGRVVQAAERVLAKRELVYESSAE